MARTRTLLAASLMGAVLLTGCEGDVEIDSPTGTPAATVTETVTETATARETVTETATETVTRGPTDGDGGTAAGAASRDLLVAPQEPVTVTPGSEAQLDLVGRLGDADAELPRLVGFGWVPCQALDATASGPLSFPDTDDDGHADRMGESDTGAARLRTVNGEPYENVDDEWPVALFTTDQEPAVTITMLATSPDCATVVFFLDDDGDEELDVADDGTPAETYGVGQLTWEE